MFRRSAEGIEVALGEQHDRLSGARTWRLPKGKREAGETLPETALREVAEETGLVARIVEELDAVHYVYEQGGRPIDKTVHFYLMEFAGEETGELDGELLRVTWHPLEAAEQALSFETERRVMVQARARLGA